MNHFPDPHLELSANDRRLLDALVEAEFDIEAMGPLTDAERLRIEALKHLFGLLEDYPVEDADDTLIHATMAGIDRYDHERTSRMKLDPDVIENTKILGGRRVPLPDFISVAAVILILVGLCWPIMSRARNQSFDRQCASNMRILAGAFQQYALDNNSVMPTSMAGLGSVSWDQVRNIINLQPLVKQGYCSQDHLNCPGNHSHDGSSYSYQWQQPSSPLMWGADSAIVMLGDRNPLIDASISGKLVPSNSMSINHEGRGQNVLMSDGAVFWLEEPKIGRDNIWLPEGMMYLQMGQQASSSEDTFLVH